MIFITHGYRMLYATFDFLIKIKNINLLIVVSIILACPASDWSWVLLLHSHFALWNFTIILTIHKEVSINSSLNHRISTKTKFAILLMFIYYSDNFFNCMCTKTGLATWRSLLKYLFPITLYLTRDYKYWINKL